jgi:hypothetical protein
MLNSLRRLPVENSNAVGVGLAGRGRRADGTLTVADGQAVGTIKRGAFVIKAGNEYRVRATRGRVFQLETLDGSFAFFTVASLCALSPSAD